MEYFVYSLGVLKQRVVISSDLQSSTLRRCAPENERFSSIGFAVVVSGASRLRDLKVELYRSPSPQHQPTDLESQALDASTPRTSDARLSYDSRSIDCRCRGMWL